MPETVIAVLTALGVGGIVGGWFAARRERAERFREHMVTSCVSFLQKAAEARSALEDAERAADAERPDRLVTAADTVGALDAQAFVLHLFFPQNPRPTVRGAMISFYLTLDRAYRRALYRLRRRRLVPGIPTRSEMQALQAWRRQYQPTQAAAKTAESLVASYWAWYEYMTKDEYMTKGGTLELAQDLDGGPWRLVDDPNRPLGKSALLRTYHDLDEIKEEALSDYRFFCDVANRAIRGRAF